MYGTKYVKKSLQESPFQIKIGTNPKVCPYRSCSITVQQKAT